MKVMCDLGGSARRWAFIAVLVGARAGAQTAAAYQEQVAKLGDPESLFRTGQYKSAAEVLATLPKSDANWVAAQALRVRALTMIGHYDEAERIGREAIAATGGNAVLTTLGSMLLE